MKHKYSLLPICALFFSSHLFAVKVHAQVSPTTNASTNVNTVKVSGKVTASDMPDGFPGVAVMVKGSTTGTATNAEGTYSLSVPEGSTLVFSMVGYTTQERKIGNSSTINIVLETDVKGLEEVVVVGYGTQKKSDITGSVARVTSEAIEERPIARLENALAGQFAGVQVRSTTGAPGAPLQIRVRGTASINANSDPLYVVDGLPMDDINGLNPSDVESIEVLKDASSAAIYGSRGSNGVVIITTKKGKQGQSKIQLSVLSGIQQLANKVDVLSAEEWIDFRKETIDREWVARGVREGKNYSASDPTDFRIAELGGLNTTYIYDPRWEYGTDSLTFIDWQDEFYRPAPFNDYQLSVMGGTENLSYRISGNYMKQEGIGINTDYSRLALRANIEAKVRKGITMGINLAPTLSWGNGGRVDGKDGMAHRVMTQVPLASLEAGLNTGIKPYSRYEWAGSATSPVAYMRETMQTSEEARNMSTVYLRTDILPGLQAFVQGGWNSRSNDDEVYIPTNIAPNWGNYAEGEASRSDKRTSKSNHYTLQSTLNYIKQIKDHSINLMVGYAAEQTKGESTFQRHSQFGNDWTNLFDRGSSTVNNSDIGAYEQTLLSYFSRVQYNYKEKYLFSASFRRDGSSKFGMSNKWGTFPAFSVGWRVSNEAFLKDRLTWLSDLKFRGSWGETGNNRIPDNAPLALLGSANYPLNNEVEFGYTSVSIANPNLGWEKTRSYNIGVDLGLLQNRIYVSADMYNSKTTDLLFQVPIAAATGFTRTWENIGSVENKGLELELRTVNISNSDFSWNTSFNLAHNKNRVLELGNNNTPIPTGFSNMTAIIQVGQPINSFMLYDAIGVYMNQQQVEDLPHMANTQPGDPIYKDVNNDGEININDRTILGSPNPDYIFGFTNTFNYKKFDLSLMLQGQQGGKIYSMIGRALDRPGMGALYNVLGHWNDRWRSEEDPGNGVVPSLYATTGSYYDSRWLYDASYLRIKNITMGYNLPTSKWYDFARVYVSVENAYTWHRYSGGYDPESSNNEGGDYGGYPISRTYSLGLNFTF